jgi:hypothetical protein
MAEPKDTKPTAGTNELGLTGLSYTTDGQVTEEFLPALRTNAQATKVYREMAWNDPTVGAILFALDMLIRQAKWSVEANPMSEGSQDEEIKFIKECMEDMSHTWEDFISEVLSMLVYGWSAFEIVYKKRSGYKGDGTAEATSNYSDGKIGWRKLAIRSQDTLYKWEIGEKDGQMRALVQKAPPLQLEVSIPIEKLLLFRTTTTKGSPEGRSVLRNAYRPWFFKSKIEEIEAIGMERDLAGLPIAKVPAEMLLPTATTEEKTTINAIKSIVQNIKRDKEEGIVWPLAYDEMGNQLFQLELMSSGGSRSFDTSSIIDRYDRRIATTVLADFIFLGQQSSGSYALSSDKTALFSVAINAWLNMIEGVVNQWGVKRLLEVNGMDSANPPLIKHGDVEKPDLTTLASYIGSLAGIGMQLFPDDALEEYLRDISSLPQPSPETKKALDEAKLQQQQAQQGVAPGAAPAGEEAGGQPADAAAPEVSSIFGSA